MKTVALLTVMILLVGLVSANDGVSGALGFILGILCGLIAGLITGMVADHRGWWPFDFKEREGK